ncbi:uncharacterized protein E0L32_010202 [Thyridium curvatum]|uniref:PEBP-like protein n=1 Tax=Thyridium curvatum TaxID=1093900 RepID=A0A507AF80_9PEZI|nr:uncharacterized protein E0L32_010202 [Thyridium curvatum]TPX08135.1 hypothetical protein E0L32_010202 [Thyridium curvatum]
MGKETPSLQLALSRPGQPTTLRATFPSGATVTENGVSLTPAQAKEPPTWSVPGTLAKPGQKYMVLATDLDAPFPSLPLLGPILHGLQLDLTASSSKGPDDGGWTALETSAKPVVPYIGPGPPPMSSAHRYVFMLFEQPEGLDAGKVRGLLGLKEEIPVTSRMFWKQEQAEAKMGLGKAVAGCYFLSKA